MYTFIHKSIAEFYAAEYIAFHGDPEKLYLEIDKNFMDYKNICSFLEYIDTYDFYTLFLKDKCEVAVRSFSKEVLNRLYIKNDDDLLDLSIVVTEKLSSYFSNKLRESITDAFMEDISKINKFRDIEGISITVVNIDSCCNLLNVEDLKVEGNKIINFEDEGYIYEKGVKVYEDDIGISRLSDEGYQRISILNLKNIYPGLFRELNKYIFELSTMMVKINNYIEIKSEQDEYSLD